MTRKKKFLFIIAATSLILIVPIALFVSQLYSAFAPLIMPAPHYIVEDYVEEKYGFEVEVIEQSSYGIGSPTDFSVSKENEEHIRFTVSVDPNDYTIIEDDYELALSTDKEYEKLKTVIPEVEALGFNGIEGEPIRLSNFEDMTFLHLESDNAVNFGTFATKELDSYYSLYKLIKKSGANIDAVSVADPYKENETQNGVSFSMEESQKERTKEQFLIDLKKAHIEISAHEIENRLATEAEQLNNERFYLGNQYLETPSEPVASWFNCSAPNELGDCEAGVVSVTYEKDALNRSNPKLIGDVRSIIQFVELHLEPEIKIEYIYFQGSDLSPEELAIGYEDRLTYKNTDELINYLLDEQ